MLDFELYKIGAMSIKIDSEFSIDNIERFKGDGYEVSNTFKLIKYGIDEKICVNKNLKIIQHNDGSMTIKNVHQVIPNVRHVFLV